LIHGGESRRVQEPGRHEKPPAGGYDLPKAQQASREVKTLAVTRRLRERLLCVDPFQSKEGACLTHVLSY
jgi:hypothetical protein